MKNLICALVILTGIQVFAANRNWYCGQGREKHSVDDAQLSLVAQGSNVQIYEMVEGKKQKVEGYTISAKGSGFLAVPENDSPNSGEAVMTFSACKNDETASLQLSGSMAPTATLPCTCESE